MFDAILDVVFPLSFVALPTLAVIYLAGLVFGKQETVGFVKSVARYVWGACASLAGRLHRAAVVFITDDVPEWQIEDLFIRLDRLEEQVIDLAGRFSRMEADVDGLHDDVSDLRTAEEDYVAASKPSREYEEADLPF
jgi:hypothetical protein